MSGRTTAEPALRRAIIDACGRMVASGLVVGTSGNVSVRVSGGMLITPSGVAYDRMRPEQIAFVGADGAARGQERPSSEWRMHLDLYKARPDIGALVHSHSPHATALACQRRPIPAFHYMVAAAGGTDIRCADYATFGTQALSTSVVHAMEGRMACLMANHGQIAGGATLDRAVALATEVENLAHHYTIALSMGEPEILDPVEMRRVLDLFADYGPRTAAGVSSSTIS